MEFLANENFPLFSIKLLRTAGYNVMSVQEESPGADDSEIIKRAHQKSLVILTFDRDYGELIYRYNSLVPAGIIYFRFGPATPEEPAEILLRILQEREITIVGKFTVLGRNKIRQRPL